MQIKMSEVLVLNNLYDKIKTQSTSIKTTYKLSKLFKAIQEENEFYTSELNKIIAEYAEHDENGNPVFLESGGIKVKEGFAQTTKEKLNELWELEVELPDVQFTLDELDTISLTVEEFNPLLPFIKE